MLTLTQRIQDRARELGFELVGITPAAHSETIARYKQWLENGYAGKMDYLKRHLPLKTDVRQLLAEAKSVISLAMNYYTLDPPESTRGRIRNVGKSLVMLGEMTITNLSVNVF